MTFKEVVIVMIYSYNKISSESTRLPQARPNSIWIVSPVNIVCTKYIDTQIKGSISFIYFNSLHGGS